MNKIMPKYIKTQSIFDLSNSRIRKGNSIKKSPLNNFIYEYPISIIKEPTQFEKYKERLLLSGKQNKTKNLINKNYHHIEFKSHSKSILINPNDIFKNIQNKNLLELYQNIFQNMKQIKSNDTIEVKKILHKNNSNPLFRPLNLEKTSINFDLNNFFQKVYLNQIRRRGFNYNKIKTTSMQRNAMSVLNKLQENNLDLETVKNNKSGFVLEVKDRKILPKMKTYFINKLNLMRLKNEYINEQKFKLEKNPKPCINIKKSNFKFHVFHDIYGKERDLGKPYDRDLKMTDYRIRDLILLNKIKQVRDPEIIEKFRTAIL